MDTSSEICQLSEDEDAQPSTSKTNNHQNGNSGEASVVDLEEEIRELERQLKHEREQRKQQHLQAQEELDREVQAAEERWMERARQAIQERDALATRTQQMEEQMDAIRIDVNRAVAYRLEMEESRNRMKAQLDAVQRDYEETMHERSSVLEENARLSEDRETLRQTVHQLNCSLNEMTNRRADDEIQALTGKLDHTRRLLQLNMEETAVANQKRTDAMEKLTRVLEQLERVSEERDEAVRRARDADCEREPIVDLWNTHTVEVALSYPKPNLGIVLCGGRSDDRYSVHSPIYVKDVLIGSPLENMLKRLDHILIVNDIDVTDMDQRSVIDILKNSHHLKMVIRRRANANKIHEVTLGGSHDIGIELGNGVFVNGVAAAGAADRAGIRPGYRVVHVNHVPVYEAKHAEQLIKYSSGSVQIGLLDGKKRPDAAAFPKELASTKQKTLFSKWFGRHNTEKPRPVVAKANIAGSSASAAETAFYRQGSLRIPAPQQNTTTELVRYGSLRAPPGSAESARISEQLDHLLNKSHAKRYSAMSESAGSTWPNGVPPEEEPAPPRRRLHRPSVFPVFQTPNSPANPRLVRQSSELPSRCGGSSSPWSPRMQHTPSIDGRSAAAPSPASDRFGHRDNRVSCYSPALPQPPPYPGPREDSLSSILSSTNSLPLPGSSSLSMNYHNYTNNSPSGTLMSESSDKVRRVHLSKEGLGSEFGLGLENSNGGVIISAVQGRANGLVKRGDRLLDVGGINMRSADKESASKVLSQYGASHDEVTLLVSGQLAARWVQVPRKLVRLCGGNAIGILAEAGANELQEGDLILEIDGFNVRGATLEEATEALLESLSEMADLLVEDGGDRLNRLRLGADGDSFYVRINTDRGSENKDELDIKAGEIVFVDKTLFMGQRGRWRAWKVDREGRQRENGIIPSASHMERQELRGRKNKSRPSLTLTRPIYERMERVCSAKRRPIVIFGAVVAPFTQALMDDNNKFAPAVPECRALQSAEAERMLQSGELIEARRREKLFDVISAAAITNIMDKGFHCIVDVSAAGIHRLHSLRIHPIVMRVKFKSSKQIKDVYEDFSGEKLNSKQIKELLEKAASAENELEAAGIPVTVIQVNSQGQTRNLVKHVCQQISLHADHEQKKTVWVTL